jgi:hypothetical protein
LFDVRNRIIPEFAHGSTSLKLSEVLINVSTQNIGQGNKKGRADVLIVDQGGIPVEGATVNGIFSGGFDQSVSNVSTDSSGLAVFLTTESKKGGVTFTFCVNEVTHTTITDYKASDNVATCATF